MNDLDFTRAPVDNTPADGHPVDTIYDPAAARACFESLGEKCNVAKDGAFFAENEKSTHMYLLLEGEVRIFRRKTVLDIVRGGEVFGELAAITGRPRTAWSVARTHCKALRLDTTKLREAIVNTPEFALMLVSIMIVRTRLALDLLARAGKLSERLANRDSCVFTRETIAELAKELGNTQPVKADEGKSIMREGDTGANMYAVLSGRVAVRIKNVTIDHIGPGGLIGELTLVDQARCAATAIAESDTTLLAISRENLLSLVRSDPRFALTLLRSLASRLSRLTFSSA